jgi:surface polysaccharide O-acyltransferase-like enzyme
MVGRNTLPIYVLHPLLLHGLLLAVPKPQAMPGASWIILLTLATVLLGLLIGRWLNRIPGLLSLPRLPWVADRRASLGAWAACRLA